ncbi:carbohydrate-binding family 9-like protein [Sphingobacterium griseoflavum]|uniref:Carbohydrate-binding domain-containing protein n=1 Tax=Sphingobacterium griseoflavum TaxID=1474952 RepID=A0ABQ3HWY3_9SPHI|nr:carbohydrate-binding family 9-like protein [Sphingobacterium griseoflavum]GHE42747.1 hypothetical protein GCM10017764_27740 [Sphingobacterium griseoflavum]
MKKLTVELRDVALAEFDYYEVARQMADLSWQPVAQQNWRDQFPDKPNVAFQIAHNNKGILLHFAVEEQFIKAQYVRPNEAVWEDSCVEFFVSFDNKQHYYNIEFNVAGTGLIGYGPEIKTDRTRLKADVISEVMTATSIVNRQSTKRWYMIMYISSTVFIHSELTMLSGLLAHGNFYKCGDGLPNAHFLSWAPILAPNPNFHLPAFFGELVFQ